MIAKASTKKRKAVKKAAKKKEVDKWQSCPNKDSPRAKLCRERFIQHKKYIKALEDKQKILIDLLRKLENSTGQSGGSNNVYINKCKNHRHNKTKKFRMKLKDIDNWVYLEPRKKKKYTRRKY